MILLVGVDVKDSELIKFSNATKRLKLPDSEQTIYPSHQPNVKGKPKNKGKLTASNLDKLNQKNEEGYLSDESEKALIGLH